MGRRTANVRLFLPTVGTTPEEYRWRDLALEYVSAMVNRQLEILILAIPFVSLHPEDPWYAYRDLFFGRLATDYLNVVFGVTPIRTTNFLTGLRAMQAKTDAKLGTDKDGPELEEPGEVPELVRLYTRGVRNLAVIATWPRDLVPTELAALQSYQYVCAPSIEEAEALQKKYGLNVIPAPPTVFAIEVAEMLR